MKSMGETPGTVRSDLSDRVDSDNVCDISTSMGGRCRGNESRTIYYFLLCYSIDVQNLNNYSNSLVIIIILIVQYCSRLKDNFCMRT